MISLVSYTGPALRRASYLGSNSLQLLSSFLIILTLTLYFRSPIENDAYTEDLEPQLLHGPASNHLPWMGFQLLAPQPLAPDSDPPSDHCCPLLCLGQGSMYTTNGIQG